jgi:hypothetical protein
MEPGWIDLAPELLTFRNIRAEVAASGDPNIRAALIRYIHHDKNRARKLLDHWEEDRERPDQLFGKNRSLPFVIELRNFLRANNMMPERPDDWIDPLGEDQYNALKLFNQDKHLRTLKQFKIDAANRKLGLVAQEETTGQGPSESKSTESQCHTAVTGIQLSSKVRRAARNGKKRMEQLHHAGLLQLTKEDVRGRTVREVIAEALASGRRARNSVASNATSLPPAEQAPLPVPSGTASGTDTRPTDDDSPEEAMSISRETSPVCVRRVVRVATPDRELENTPSTSTQDAATNTSPPSTSDSSARREFIFAKGRKLLARAFATKGMEALPSNEVDDFVMGTESTEWFLEFIETLSEYEYKVLDTYYLKGEARRLEAQKAAALAVAEQRAKSAKRSKKSKKKSK